MLVSAIQQLESAISVCTYMCACMHVCVCVCVCVHSPSFLSLSPLYATTERQAGLPTSHLFYTWYFHLENCKDTGAWRATGHGVAQNQTHLSTLYTHNVYISVLLSRLVLPSPSPSVSTSPFSTCFSLFLP